MHASQAAPARKRSYAAPIVGIAIVLALGGWVGLRVKGALSSQAQVAQSRDTVAKAAAEASARPKSVSIVRGTPEQWQPRVGFDGTLAPVREADLGFKTAGRIGAIRVKVGDKVAAGALLASLEATEASAQVIAAQAQVRAAEAQLALAADSDKRTSALVKTGGVSESLGVQATNQKALALAQLDAAKAQVALARVNLQNHTLTAPFAGIITRVPAGPGAVVGGGIAQFHLSDLSTLKLVGTVGDSDASLVKVGAEVEISAEGAPVIGKVSSVLASVDQATRRVPVEADVPNGADKGLRGGAFARAQIKGGAAIPVLRLPRAALRPGSQDEIMLVHNDTLSPRRVVFVGAPDGSLLVRSGLTATDDVLLSPSPEAKEGDKVQVTR